MLGCRVPVMPRKKLATSLFRARPVRWVQPKDSRLVATSDSLREKENWTEVDSQRSRDREARRNRAPLEPPRFGVQRIDACSVDR